VAEERRWGGEGPVPLPELFALLGSLLHDARARGEADAAWRLGLRSVQSMLSSGGDSSGVPAAATTKVGAAGSLAAAAEAWLLSPPPISLAEAACCLTAALAPLLVKRERQRKAGAGPGRKENDGLKENKPHGHDQPTSVPAFDSTAWAKALGGFLSSGQLSRPADAIGALAPLLRSGLLHVSCVEAHALPQLAKALRRAAEPALACVTALLDALPPTANLTPAAASTLAEALAPTIATGTPATATAPSAAAAAAATTLRSRTDPVSATAAVLALIGGTGKGSQLPAPARIALAEALGGLATPPPTVSAGLLPQAVSSPPSAGVAPLSTGRRRRAGGGGAAAGVGRAEIEAGVWATPASCSPLAAEWAAAAQHGCDAVGSLLLPLCARETSEPSRTAMLAAVGRWMAARGVGAEDTAGGAQGKGSADTGGGAPPKGSADTAAGAQAKGAADTAAGALAKGLAEKSAEVRRGHLAAVLAGLSCAAMQIDAAMQMDAAGKAGNAGWLESAEGLTAGEAGAAGWSEGAGGAGAGGGVGEKGGGAGAAGGWAALAVRYPCGGALLPLLEPGALGEQLLSLVKSAIKKAPAAGAARAGAERRVGGGGEGDGRGHREGCEGCVGCGGRKHLLSLV
jgi:hypothetical protein